MLTADRQQLTERAVECFCRQTYEHKRLMILDTGKRWHLPLRQMMPGVGYFHRPEAAGLPIGELRNVANALAAKAHADVFAHFDSDDWSHPYRLAEQVNHLMTTEADCVGYNDLIFFDSRKRAAWLYQSVPPDPHFAIGTSLVYWRRTWERTPFDAVYEGEDRRFIRALRTMGTTSCPLNPRLIAEVHGRNTVATPERFESWTTAYNQKNFLRYPGMDAYCKGVLLWNTDPLKSSVRSTATSGAPGSPTATPSITAAVP